MFYYHHDIQPHVDTGWGSQDTQFHDRLGHLFIIHKDYIDDWLEDYLKWYRNGVEEQETEGSGFVYNG